MTENEVQAAKDRLDTELVNAGQNVGIAFGSDLFNELVKAGHISKKTFGFLGTMIWTESLPAYGSRYAFSDWELPKNGFKIGSDT